MAIDVGMVEPVIMNGCHYYHYYIMFIPIESTFCAPSFWTLYQNKPQQWAVTTTMKEMMMSIRKTLKLKLCKNVLHLAGFCVSDAKFCIMRLINQIFKIFQIPRAHQNGLEILQNLTSLGVIWARSCIIFALFLSQAALCDMI